MVSSIVFFKSFIDEELPCRYAVNKPLVVVAVVVVVVVVVLVDWHVQKNIRQETSIWWKEAQL